MSKKKSMTGEVMHDGRTAYDAILKADALKTNAVAQELAWASAEENPNFLIFFGKLAEIQFIHSMAEKRMAEKFLEVNKSFRNIFQEERVMEETKKEQQNYQLKLTKLQKQLDLSRKKGDHLKTHSLENEVTLQGNLYNQLSQSVEAKARKLELYKVSLVKRGLRHQAEGVITLSGFCQQLYAAEMELIDLLPDEPAPPKEVSQELSCKMSDVVTRVSNMLSIATPSMGGMEHPSRDFSVSNSQRRSLMIDSFSFLGGGKIESESSSKVGRRRVSSCSDDMDDPLSEPPPLPPPRSVCYNSHYPTVPMLPKLSSPVAPPESCQKPSVYCEIVIPAVNTDDKPVLAKVWSESQLPVAEETSHSQVITRQQSDTQLLKLPKYVKTSTDSASPSPSPFSSTEDFATNCSDSGYSKLMLLSRHPAKRSDSNKVERVEDEDYANPVDALKSNRRVSKLYQDKFVHSPSPPSSPIAPDVPPRNSLGPYQSVDAYQSVDTYQSVDEVRKMREMQLREMQLREKEMEEVKLKEKNKRYKRMLSTDGAAEASVNRHFQYDDNPGYSRPFDALHGNSTCLLASELKRSPPTTGGGEEKGDGGGKGGKGGKVVGHTHRSNSSEKLSKEPSARFLHHVETGFSSTGHFPNVGRLPPIRAQNSNPDMTTTIRAPNSSPDMRTIGVDLQTLHDQNSVPNNSSKSENQTCVNVEHPGTQVNRYILKVEDRIAERENLSRGETGRTSSVDSAYKSYTPTKLRNGRGHVTIGKFKSRKQTKEGQ